ncbi:hypothetical protein BS78_09G081300 [Paspalum vaginatum]|nr:hypothetical protein BS78_09G081300 [Paspalum vaginatum]
MASSSHKIVIGFCVLLMTASPSMLQARMAPSDHARADQARVSDSIPPSPIGSIATAALPSQNLAQDMTRPMPIPAAPGMASKPEIAVDNKRWGTTQVADGSVPSPGVGHGQTLQ